MMTEERAALTVADLCSTSNDSTPTGEFGDHSTIGYDHSTIDYDHSTIDYADEEDSFLANNSLCKQHKSTIRMLNSLRREVVQMVRSDGNFETPRHSPRNVTIDLTSVADISSPLGSPILERDTVSVSKDDITEAPSLIIKKKKSPFFSNDESTFCSMDDSIQHEMNVLREVARDLEKELKEATMNTVFEAIERIGESDDPGTKNVLGSEDKDVIRDGIRKEIQKQELLQQRTVLDRLRTNIVGYVESLEGDWLNVKVVMASIAVALIRKSLFAWIE
mmetsp:Transcript_3356/g.9321  ORF Transcript_3356/g.9321 Transcript_3356/m.9321 type:complete len:277 (+) Transcript_3356:471-1301(+)